MQLRPSRSAHWSESPFKSAKRPDSQVQRRSTCDRWASWQDFQNKGYFCWASGASLVPSHDWRCSLLWRWRRGHKMLGHDADFSVPKNTRRSHKANPGDGGAESATFFNWLGSVNSPLERGATQFCAQNWQGARQSCVLNCCDFQVSFHRIAEQRESLEHPRKPDRK